MILAKEDDAATRDDLEAALKEFDAIAQAEGINVHSEQKHLPSEQEILEENFNTMVMPLRE